jgi:hypothetical protein
MSNTMLITMIALFLFTMFWWHQAAIYIVTHYGIVGTVIACGIILIATSLIADR